jgi:prepilin peptidase CpaA
VAPTVKWAIVAGLALAAAAWDLRFRRVPNALTFGTAAIAFALTGFHTGIEGLASSLLGCLTGLALFLPLFAVGGMGGGDVKLLGAFGACLGPKGVLWAAFWASMAGGVLAIVVGAWHGYLSEAFRNLGGIVGVWRAVGPTRIQGVTLGDSRGPRLAYAVPVGVGAMLALWLGQA